MSGLLALSGASSLCAQSSNHVPGRAHQSSGTARSRGCLARSFCEQVNRSDLGASLMSTFRRAFSSSVGTKLLMGLTGLALFAYLVLHLIGNALIFAGPDIFNEYSHRLVSNPLDHSDRTRAARNLSASHLQSGHELPSESGGTPGWLQDEEIRRPHQPQERGLVDDDLVGTGNCVLRDRPRQAVQVRRVVSDSQRQSDPRSRAHRVRSLQPSHLGRRSTSSPR